MTATLTPTCFQVRQGPPPCTGPQRTRIINLSNQNTLTRQERHELALMVLGVQITSFDDLYQRGADRLIAALTGHLTHQRILTARHNPTGTLSPVPDATGDEPLPERPVTTQQLRRLHWQCRTHGYTSPERHFFASEILHVPVPTFRTLNIREAGFVLDGFTGIEAITWLLAHPLPIGAPH